MNNQYKRGVLELCVLSLLYRGDRYGYDISEFLSRHIKISEGTVYPILRKLKSDGFVTTYLSEQSGGPPRKYYSMTKTGREEYLTQKTDWLEFIASVETLLEGDGKNE
jgi:PadR family transcriptional regulator PadR